MEGKEREEEESIINLFIPFYDMDVFRLKSQRCRMSYVLMRQRWSCRKVIAQKGMI